jgi:hypothetical protein
MKKYTLVLFFMLSSTFSFSQVNLGDALEGTLADAEILLKGYVRPIAEGFGYSVNGGWFTTAKTHKLFGFDIGVVASAAIVPTSGETYTFNNSDYSSSLQLYDTEISTDELPTFFGSQDLEDRPFLTFTDSNGNSINTSALPGSGLREAIGFNAVPSAAIQVGVGIFKSTDLKFRFVPKQAAPEYEFSSFGFGIQHDLKQWIPFVKRLPFDVSALVAWNDVKSKAFLDAENNPTQALEFTTNTFLFQILASKKLSIFTIYGGIGASSYTSDVNLLGSYQEVSEPDPISLNYKGGSLRANLGLTMKVLFLNLSADYAVQEYNTFSVTAGFSVR